MRLPGESRTVGNSVIILTLTTEGKIQMKGVWREGENEKRDRATERQRDRETEQQSNRATERQRDSDVWET